MIEAVGSSQQVDPATWPGELPESCARIVQEEEAVVRTVDRSVNSPFCVEPHSSTKPPAGAPISSTVPTAQYILRRCVAKDRAVVPALLLSDLLGTVREFL